MLHDITDVFHASKVIENVTCFLNNCLRGIKERVTAFLSSCQYCKNRPIHRKNPLPPSSASGTFTIIHLPPFVHIKVKGYLCHITIKNIYV